MIIDENGGLVKAGFNSKEEAELQCELNTHLVREYEIEFRKVKDPSFIVSPRHKFLVDEASSYIPTKDEGGLTHLYDKAQALPLPKMGGSFDEFLANLENVNVMLEKESIVINKLKQERGEKNE